MERDMNKSDSPDAIKKNKLDVDAYLVRTSIFSAFLFCFGALIQVFLSEFNFKRPDHYLSYFKKARQYLECSFITVYDGDRAPLLHVRNHHFYIALDSTISALYSTISTLY